MEKFDIQKLRELPIEGVAERLGLKVSRHKALCPYHSDSHPSLTFNVAKNTFKCFVCSSHGGVIDLAMHVLNKNFVETCQWLADEHNIILNEWKPAEKPRKNRPLDLEWLSSLVAVPQLNAEAQHFLFDERKINPAVVRWLGISSISQPTPCWKYGKPYYDAPSLLIPYRDINCNLLSVQSRYLGKKEFSDNSRVIDGNSRLKEIPRFKFPRGSRCSIYNLTILRLLKPGEPLFITEGVTDCMAMLSAGHKAIAIPSATLLSRDDKTLLKEFSSSLSSSLNLHMYPDADIPGEKLYFQLVSLANEIGASLQRHSLPPGCKDFGQYWATQQIICE